MEKPESYFQIFNEEKEIEKEVEEQIHPIQDTPCAELEIENIEDTSYVENEKGEKFEKSLSPSRRQDANFIDGKKFSYYETFGLTKYSATDKLKVQIMFKGEPIIIELEKCLHFFCSPL